MTDKRKTVVAICILIGFFAVLLTLVWMIFFRPKLVSPIPDQGSIQILFLTPTPSPTSRGVFSVSQTPTPTSGE